MRKAAWCVGLCVVYVLFCMCVLSVWCYVADAGLYMLEVGRWEGGADIKSPAFVSCSDRVVPVFAVVRFVLCMNVLGERLVQVCGGK